MCILDNMNLSNYLTLSHDEYNDKVLSYGYTGDSERDLLVFLMRPEISNALNNYFINLKKVSESYVQNGHTL